DIEFLGQKSVKKFCQWAWLKSYSDIYDLKNKDLKNQEGFGEKSYRLLVESLDKSKKTTLSRLLFALGIPLVGEQTAQKISEKIYEKYKKPDLDILSALSFLKTISQEELEDISDIGPLVASSLKNAFENQELVEDLKGLHDRGVHFTQKEDKKDLLKDLVFVITGSFPISRSKIKNQIESLGGRVSSQVSGKTSFLIEGKKPGSKKEKALNLSVPILSYEDFLGKFLGRL
ncbi:MAG: NAD-dependent DNA ligase LigA, partial [Oligoflexia bacterium]|nr:NAD-dependent DNA ligase LigA [Oligoflexia bacterium]